MPTNIRDLGKHLIGTLVGAMPHRVRRIAFEAIVRAEDPWWALSHVGPRCPLHGVSVVGSVGVIESAPTDRTILRRYAETGSWADRTVQVLSAFFHGHGGQYVDVGANIGLVTIPIAQKAGVRCLAIEPDPTNFMHLAANVQRHCRNGNVELRQCAAYSHREKLSFELSDVNLGDHRLRVHDVKGGQLNEGAWRTIEVQAEPLDALVPPDSDRLAVKIDTQGAEPYVVMGGRETLTRAGLVILEWAPYWLARLGGEPRAVTDFLRANFESVSIADREDGPVPAPLPVARAVERLLEMVDRDKGDHVRYVDVIARK